MTRLIYQVEGIIKKPFARYVNPLLLLGSFTPVLLSGYLFSSDIIYDDRLMELNFGEWELQEWDKIQHPDIDRWMTDFVNTPCPNGESFLDMHKRIISFISDLHIEKCKNIAIIAHGGSIRNFITHIKNEDLKDAFKKEINYGEIIKLEI